MKLYLTAIVIFVLSTICANAQLVDGPYSLLDYRFLAPASQSLHRGQLYVSYHDRGGLMVFDTALKTPSHIDALSKELVAHLFRVGDVQMVASTGGGIRYLDESNAQWQLLGEFDCLPFVDGNKMYVLSDGNVSLFQYSGVSWVDTAVGRIDAGVSKVSSFVIVGDTIVYAVWNSKDITIATLDGSVLHSVESHSPVDGLLLLGDGSIAISANYRTSQILRTASLAFGSIDYLYYRSSLLSLTNATAFQSNGKRGIVGTFHVLGADPRKGVYVVVTPDSIEKRSDLDSVVDDVILATLQDDRWVLSTYRHIAVVDGQGAITRARWYQDTALGISSGVSFSANGMPFLCGDVKYNGRMQPLMYPTTDSEQIMVLPIAHEKALQLIRYVHLNGGPEVAFCSQGIFTKDRSDLWTTAYITISNFRSHDIDVVNDSIIVCRSIARRLLISTDKGLTWQSSIIKDYLTQMTPVISSGKTMFAHAGGIIWAIDLDNLADSITPSIADISQGFHQRLFTCTPDEVTSITARSDSDPKYNPDLYTHLVCHRWNYVDGRIDSVTHILAIPLTSGGLRVFVRKDTAYLWDFLQRRLLAVTYAGIVYDTTLPASAFGPYGDQPLPYVVADNQGNPWLFANGQVTGFRLNPSTAPVTSVQDYYDYLYVSSIKPNPASDNVRVTLGRFPAAIDDGMRLYLVDLYGNIVRNYTQLLLPFPGPSSTQDVQINVDELPRGMYLIVVENRQGKSVGKVVVTP